MKEALARTAGAYIAEYKTKDRRDSYWSMAKDGTGVNFLGALLMKIRKELFGTTSDPRWYYANVFL